MVKNILIIVGSLIWVLCFSYLFVLNAESFDQFKVVYSEKVYIRAFQMCLMFFWGVSVVIGFVIPFMPGMIIKSIVKQRHQPDSQKRAHELIGQIIQRFEIPGLVNAELFVEILKRIHILSLGYGKYVTIEQIDSIVKRHLKKNGL
jgi:ABC-type dipeptide/oligopeptide/nickel transport system permease component